MAGRAAGSDRVPIYRMHSDMTGAPLRDLRYPTRRQYSADLAYDLLPRGGSVDGLVAPGPSGLDPVFEQQISMPQVPCPWQLYLSYSSMAVFLTQLSSLNLDWCDVVLP